MALSFSLSLSHIPLSISPFGCSPSTVNDAFYAGVKALVAKTAVAFVSSNAATIVYGRSEREQTVMILEMIYSSLIAPPPSPTFPSFFSRAGISTSHVAIFFAIVSISLPTAEDKAKTNGIDLMRKSRSGLHLPKWKPPWWSISNDYSILNLLFHIL